MPIENRYKPKRNYGKYLQSESWRKIKGRHYRKQENKVCSVCNSTQNLHVHHKTYIDKRGNQILGHEQSHHLQTLCRECHLDFHKKLKEEDRIRRLGTIAYYKLTKSVSRQLSRIGNLLSYLLITGLMCPENISGKWD